MGNPEGKSRKFLSFFSLSLCQRMVPPPFHPPPFSLWPLGRERSRRRGGGRRAATGLQLDSTRLISLSHKLGRRSREGDFQKKKKIAHTATAEPGSVFSAPFALISTLQDRDSPIGLSTESAVHIFSLKIGESRGICRLTHGTAILLLFGMQSKVASAAAAF